MRKHCGHLLCYSLQGYKSENHYHTYAIIIAMMLTMFKSELKWNISDFI